MMGALLFFPAILKNKKFQRGFFGFFYSYCKSDESSFAKTFAKFLLSKN